MSLLVGLLAGLVFFRMLTRRLSRLTERVESFERELSSEQSPPLAEKGDDIDYLASRFDLMARRIVAQLDLLKHKDAQRRQLVAQVSHDLRTPLASIQGYLEALRMKHETLEAEERGRFLAVALSETHRLGRQVEELFELAAWTPVKNSRISSRLSWLSCSTTSFRSIGLRQNELVLSSSFRRQRPRACWRISR